MSIKTFWLEDCGAVATDTGGSSRLFRNVLTGEVFGGPRKLPPGALLIAAREGGEQRYPYRFGADGLAIAVVMPDGGWWYPESRASNCTMKDDDVHRCWVRHGTFKETIHVDKNGCTCQAGAGSIMWSLAEGRTWHGFLHNGELKEC